jgi:hypothetical protein
MKILTMTLIVLGMAAAVAPAYARTHCYVINGKMTCCTELKTITTCN